MSLEAVTQLGYGYELDHSPNCPKPFRMILKRRPLLPNGQLLWCRGFGATPDEAAADALGRFHSVANARIFRELWSGL